MQQKLPLRERRYHQALAALERSRKRREDLIKSLVRCELLIPKLERKARRLGAPPKVKASQPEPAPVLPTIEPEVAADGIPDFLRRSADDEAAAEIRAQQDAEKKRKAERSAEKRKINAEVRHAELTGKRRKMPLSGREALAAIRE